MEDKIEVGEYVRTADGTIAKLVDVILHINTYCFDNTIHTENFEDGVTMLDGYELGEYIVKHSFKKSDVVKEGDILKYKINNLSAYKIGEVKKYKDARSLKEYLGVEGFSLEQIEILKIVTKELFESVGY